MPAPGQTDPTSRRTRLREFFADHPGRHRANEVARHLGDESQYVANELARMARAGDGVVSEKLPVEGRKLPITLYRAS